jgi:hypothetical protein
VFFFLLIFFSIYEEIPNNLVIRVRYRNKSSSWIKIIENGVGALQHLTVLLTEKIRRCEITTLSVIFLPTKSPIECVRRHSFHR